MDKDSLFQNAEYLRGDQYRDSQNLGARARLHQRYSSNQIGWFAWVMAKMALRPGSQVLECGCGPGWLWRDNLEGLPEACQITLTDLSPGMVAEAESVLSSAGHDFRFSNVDIAALPYDDQTFTVVVANHMLYHVPDRQKALAEVGRILKTDGRFFAATVGDKHMLELRDLRQKLMPESAATYPQASKEFSLENGLAQLAPWFSTIELYRYENHLLVTDVEPLIAYALSSSEAKSEVDPDQLQIVRQSVQKRIEEHGSFDITTNVGMFVAHN